MTTVPAFVTAITGLTLEGVRQKYDYPPAALNSVDLPAQWVQAPSVEHSILTFQSYGGWPILKALLCVAVQAVGQGRPEQTWEDVLAMMETVDAAVCALPVNTLGRARIEWTIRQATLVVGGNEYWGVTLEVTAHG